MQLGVPLTDSSVDVAFLGADALALHLRSRYTHVGEYASTIGCKQGTLMGALGEAAFLTGIERDQDKVKMTSYAPLLNNPRFTEWQPDLITFNNHQCYGIPSYYMLKMFAENKGKLE